MPEEETPAGRMKLPVRWVVFFTGFTVNEGYQPASSEDEPAMLVAEVTRLCLAFHPISQIHLFPKEDPVYLFWRAQSTQDWVVTRVSVAPNPQGLRTALEYCSLVFDDDTFRDLRCNPFRTRSLNLHDRIRRHFLAGKTTPFIHHVAAMTPKMDAGNDFDPELSLLPHEKVASSDVANLFASIRDGGTATEANVQAIQEFCSRWTEYPAPPPTFATWWSSRNPSPENCFDILLRIPEPKPLALREARAAISQYILDLKSALPIPDSADVTAVGLVNSLFSHAAAADYAIAHAAVAHISVHAQEKSLDSQHHHITEALLRLSLIRADLDALLIRLNGTLLDQQSIALQCLGSKIGEIEQGMQSIRHPNPFRKPASMSGYGSYGGHSGNGDHAGDALSNVQKGVYIKGMSIKGVPSHNVPPPALTTRMRTHASALLHTLMQKTPVA